MSEGDADKKKGTGLEALAASTTDIPIPGPDEATPLAPSGPGLDVPVVSPQPGPARVPTALDRAAQLHRAGRLDEAIQAYNAILLSDAGDPHVWANLGVALRSRGRIEAAAACYRRALAIKPDSAAVLSNLGNVLRLLGRHEEATQAQRRALEADPTYLGAAYNMALLLRDVGLWREAMTYFERAIAGGYARPEVVVDRGLTLLALGDYANGFADCETRLKMPTAANPPSPAPEWKGEALSGRSILVHVEPGPRDTVMFLRYLPLLAARGARVVVLAPASMAAVIGAIGGVAEVVTQGKPPDTDLRAPLNSLPHLFGTAPDTVPRDLPYLRVPPARAPRQWVPPAPAGHLKVGIVWADRASEQERALRACPFTCFLRLAGIPGIALYRLQTGAAAAERDQHGAGALVRDFAGEFADLADAAEAIAQLDFVVGVDSAVMLLAGGLGLPGMIALPTNADWRWGAGETTPWFPNFQLFRQRRPGDWDELFTRIAAALAARQAEPRAEAKPVAPVTTVVAPPAPPPPVRAPAPAVKPVAAPEIPRPEAPAKGKRQRLSPRRAGPPRRKAEADAPPESLALAPIPARQPEPAPEIEPQAEAKPAAPAVPPAAASPIEPEPPAPPKREAPPPMLHAAIEEEIERGGHAAAAHRFLDEHLQPRDVVIDVGVGSGLVALGAAFRHPGRVHVIALDTDASRISELRAAAERNGLAGSIEAINAGVGARGAPGRADAAPATTIDTLMADRPDLADRPVFLCLDTGGREPEVIAGALELLARGRIAAIVWHRTAAYDDPPGPRRLERLVSDLAQLGFRHLRAGDAVSAKPAPYVAQPGAATIVSLARGFEGR